MQLQCTLQFVRLYICQALYIVSSYAAVYMYKSSQADSSLQNNARSPPRPGIDCISGRGYHRIQKQRISAFVSGCSCTILKVTCVGHLVRSFTIQFMIAITMPRYNQTDRPGKEANTKVA